MTVYGYKVINITFKTNLLRSLINFGKNKSPFKDGVIKIKCMEQALETFTDLIE